MPAAGDATKVETLYGIGIVKVLEIACVCDSGDGSFSKALGYWIDGELLAIETNPGATAPTANYDVALNDAEGHDVLEGCGANRHTSTTEKVPIVYALTALHPPVAPSDVLTLAITGNSVNSAATSIKLYFRGNVGAV